MDLNHTDAHGKASMVDVSSKAPQRRVARATGTISLAPRTVALIRENEIAKGDVLTVARVAGIQAAKATAGLIPLCHPLTIDRIDVQAETADASVTVTSEVVNVARTGVEMEALTAVAVALLTVYDMCKAVDGTMTIGEVRLLEKTKQDV